MFMKSKKDIALKLSYIKYRNQLSNIMQKAKQQYYRNTLNDIKNNSSKLWSHLNSLIKNKTAHNIPISSEKLNNFFTFVF
jgi:hypothetical protein